MAQHISWCSLVGIPCPPKAEVTGSNPVGRANLINDLAKYAREGQTHQRLTNEKTVAPSDGRLLRDSRAIRHAHDESHSTPR